VWHNNNDDHDNDDNHDNDAVANATADHIRWNVDEQPSRYRSIIVKHIIDEQRRTEHSNSRSE